MYFPVKNEGCPIGDVARMVQRTEYDEIESVGVWSREMRKQIFGCVQYLMTMDDAEWIQNCSDPTSDHYHEAVKFETRRPLNSRYLAFSDRVPEAEQTCNVWVATSFDWRVRIGTEVGRGRCSAWTSRRLSESFPGVVERDADAGCTGRISMGMKGKFDRAGDRRE